jgi:tRNA(His) guanylyltransferase
MKKNDDLGNRMKEFYEDRTRYKLPRRTYSIIRIDGKAFHTYCKGLEKPFDEGFVDDMNETAIYLCKNVQGCKLGFVQSDEISLILSDFDTLNTDAWFDGNIQKIVSVSSSLTTSKFNQLRQFRYINNKFDGGMGITNITYRWFEMLEKQKLAEFDARVFTIPFVDEVINYLVWRQKDATRNSISSLAQTLYNHKELHKKSVNEMQEMCFQKGVNWNDFDFRLKRGGLIVKVDDETVKRPKWNLVETPIFTEDRFFLNKLLTF